MVNAALLTVPNKQPAVRGGVSAIVSGKASRMKIVRTDGNGQQITRLLRHIADAP